MLKTVFAVSEVVIHIGAVLQSIASGFKNIAMFIGGVAAGQLLRYITFDQPIWGKISGYIGQEA
jgi:hypothetical protein